ncbi:MAG TPA: HlyD family efflux transporter periplasmic adaptor subunit [Feifaniaceae bacterium]|nr:HlyD family efflux transporter periplasmic adaptor subunit [Feifaniaceae bacterium]
MQRVRVRGRFYVMLVVLLALLGVLVYFLVSGGKEGELTMGAMRLNSAVKTVLVRDEASITVERYDKILFDVVEGAHVKTGDQIAQVFKWGYQEQTMQSLLDVQKNILAYQLSLIKGIVNPELDALNLQIQQKQNAIRPAVRGESTADMLTLEQELKALLDARKELLKDIQPDETLAGLYEQEEQQLTNLNTWKRDILNNEGEGVVSFYFDGYEQALSAKKLNMLNSDLVSGVIRGSGVVSELDTADVSPLYRLIDPDHFYIAFLTDAQSPFRVAQGETYTVVFNGYADQPYTGTALTPILSGKQMVNLLEFNQPMNDLMGVRVVEASIMKDVTGLYVPVEAIEMRDGMPGILRIAGAETAWTQVDVLAADGEGAIVRAAAGGELAAGARYRKP